jgi:hypothetical protein
MKVNLTYLLAIIALTFTFNGLFSQKNRLSTYTKAAEEFTANLGDVNYDERGDALKLNILRSLVPLKGKIKLSQGLLSVTGIATTASGAGATGLSQVLTDDASKKMIGFVSSVATTVFGGLQIVISKTAGAVEYKKACNAAIEEWEINEAHDQKAYVKFLAKAEAIHDSFKRFATYETDIAATDAPKKVKKKELLE